MDDRVFIPVGKYIEGLWPQTVVDLPDLSLLDDIWMEPLHIETDPSITVATALLFERSLEFGIPGLDAVKIVLAPSGTATEFMLQFDEAPAPAILLVDVPIALRFRGDLLRPVRQGPADANGVQAWEVDPTRDFVDIQLATATLTFDFNGNVALTTNIALNLDPVMIGDSGVVVELQNIGIHFGDTPPQGKPAGWKGVSIAQAAVHLPAGLSGAVGTLSMTDATIGNGGFSGTVAADFNPALSTTLFGMQVSLEHAGISFVQNSLTGSEIRAALTLPFFDAPVAISIGIGLDGDLSVELRGGQNGLVTLDRPGVLSLRLDSLGFELDDGVFVARLSGGLTPKIGGLDWPEVVVRELSIDSDGNVRLEGGWLDLDQGYRLALGGFQMEITKIGFGKTEDGGRWIGFSGGLKLVDGLQAGASVDGLRISWYDDGRTSLTLEGVGVELEIPDVLRFKGSVSYRQIPGGDRFDGAIKLELLTLNLEIDGQLVIGSANGYNFMAIYLGVELPAGIPLWTTGLGLYGLAGLFALQMEPDKAPDEPWYGVGPGEGWYKRPPVGVAELTKWRNQQGSLAVGGGVTIGTIADNGFTFAGRMLLAIVFPGPILFIEGKANILKDRASLSEDPMFRALAVLDAREGSFLVGLDATYKFAGGGELIEIGGSAEAFFDFDDPTSWHLYLGQRDPRERRIRAEIFKLWEANAYFMLDARQLALGAFVGYDNSWKFGPVRARLEAWIEGHAVVSFKPAHFYGELWLHGRAELRVFGFGFDIGADARVTADVFDPFAILIELSVHLNLPWPLPDFDIDITLKWGPEPTPPALPMPLKDVAVEHFKVTTSWPLPRVSAPALLSPNYDGNADGYLGAPAPAVATVASAAPPANAPVVPLDARPHITFGRNVHDDAFVGVNPQPPFPNAAPDPGWEWIGDAAKNQGPVRIRTGLKEIALERWTGGGWVAVARRSGPNDNTDGTPTLHGSWAPVPQLPAGNAAAGTAGSPANTKLWLWSRSAFDYVRHTTGRWSDWWTDSYPGYPCVPVPEDQEICCGFNTLKPGDPIASPWRCPDHPEFALGWYYPAEARVEGTPGKIRLCFDSDDRAELRLGRTVKQVRVFIESRPSDGGDRDCLDFRDRPRRKLPNPYSENGLRFETFDFAGAPSGAIEIRERGLPDGSRASGMNIDHRMTIRLPQPVDSVHLLVTCQASEIKIVAFDANGIDVDGAGVPADKPIQAVTLSGNRITHVEIFAESNEALLHQICLTRARGEVRVVGITRSGTETPPVPVIAGEAVLTVRDLAAVRIDGNGSGFCILGFCVVVGLSRSDRTRLIAINDHLAQQTARWSDTGFVLQPYSNYRIRIVTTLETRDFQYHASFNRIREQTEFAFFRTEGPVGLTTLSRPLAAGAPQEFDSGLEDLTPYVAQTVPATVPPPGLPAPLPRPVYRAYDSGVEFNEDYVDLLYRIRGRDLGLYLYDANNRPARDVFGRLLVAANRWGRTEQLTLTETDRTWLETINTGSCAAIDETLIVRSRTLGLDGQVLDADTLHEARLVPLLLHEAFTGYALGAGASGDGATLAGPGGGWTVADIGNQSGPSVWVVAEDMATGMRFVRQDSNIWGGPDIASNPTNPGTILLRAQDPALSGDHPDQPVNWTDYRVTAILRAQDDDAIGLAVRYTGPGDHYLIALDRERSYRRLVRVTGGTYTILASDVHRHELDSDMELTVEAIGDRLRVYQDGALVFDVTDAGHAKGGIGLYCWAVEGARFADIRVDDFRATALVVYRYAFTTSRFANFYHHAHSGSGETWAAPLADINGLAGAVAAMPAATAGAAPTDPERRAYETFAAKVLGPQATADTARVESTAMTAIGAPVGLILRLSEPVDWTRTVLSVAHADGPTPALQPMPDAVPGDGPLTLTGWSTASQPDMPAAESVTLLLDKTLSPDGWQIEYRTLPSEQPAPNPDGTLLAQDSFYRITTSEDVEGAALFAPDFNDLTGLTVVDPPSLFPVPSAWAANAGVVTQTSNTSGLVFGPTAAFALPGTHLIGGDPAMSDVAIDLRLSVGAALGAFGLVFRYVDELNYYRFSLSPDGAYRRLVRNLAGNFSVLWEDAGPVAAGQDYTLRIEAVGGDLRVLLDGQELSRVRDSAHPAGQVALYTWRCRTAVFSALSVRAFARSLDGWQIVERGPLIAGSIWQREGGAMQQTAALAANPATVDPADQGAYAVTGDLDWRDVRLRLRIAVEADEPAGVALRWQGPDDHLLLVLDPRGAGQWRLVRVQNGAAGELWSAPKAFVPARWYDVSISAIGSRLRALVDDTVLFDLRDTALDRGRVALFACAGSAGRFAGFRVEAAEPQWMPYATLSGIGRRAAGRRIRLFAGREADAPGTAVTSELRRYLDFLPGDAAGVRLPPEGVDLRLRAPDGTVRHARRFAPDAAFAPVPLRIARSGDGTGLVLLSPAPGPAGAALAPGLYRLAWTYRRDNTAQVPGSQILRENGETTAEIAAIDLRI